MVLQGNGEDSTKLNQSAFWVGIILSLRWRKEIVTPRDEKITNAARGSPVKTKGMKSLLVLWTLCHPGRAYIEAPSSGIQWKDTLSSMIWISLLGILLNPHWSMERRKAEFGLCYSSSLRMWRSGNILSTDTSEQKRGTATRRLHKGWLHLEECPHVCTQSDEKLKEWRTKDT